MSLLRQGRWYLVVGGLQLLLDWAIFVALTAVHVPVVPANLAGRVGGALMGFRLNGSITFASPDEPRLGHVRFLRFALVWLVLTTISTFLLTAIASQLGMAHAWLAKPLVDGGLAVCGFFLSRHWIYR